MFFNGEISNKPALPRHKQVRGKAGTKNPREINVPTYFAVSSAILPGDSSLALSTAQLNAQNDGRKRH